MLFCYPSHKGAVANIIYHAIINYICHETNFNSKNFATISLLFLFIIFVYFLLFDIKLLQYVIR